MSTNFVHVARKAKLFVQIENWLTATQNALSVTQYAKSKLHVCFCIFNSCEMADGKCLKIVKPLHVKIPFGKAAVAEPPVGVASIIKVPWGCLSRLR